MKSECKKCIYFVSELKEEQEFQKGKCHRFPPCLLTIGGKIRHYFPIVVETDVCCGEFKEETNI